MHPLDGPRAKIGRARDGLVALELSFEAVFKRDPYRIVVGEFDPKSGHYSLRAQGGPATLPDEWGVAIGEIAHNLRSALDGLVWQLALSSVQIPYERTAFPIFRRGRTSVRHRGNRQLAPHFWGKRHGRTLLQSVPRQHWPQLESFQPYKRGNRGRYSPLFLLDRLNNTDKHRLITVVTTTPVAMSVSGLYGGASFKRRASLYPHAKVGIIRPLPPEGLVLIDPRTGQEERRVHELEVELEVTPGVRFGDGCEAVRRLLVIRTLQRMADEVSGVVESFAREF